MKPTSYGDPNRLADVMALIQVLAQAEYALRSEKGLTAQLQGVPEVCDDLDEARREPPRILSSSAPRRQKAAS